MTQWLEQRGQSINLTKPVNDVGSSSTRARYEIYYKVHVT